MLVCAYVCAYVFALCMCLRVFTCAYVFVYVHMLIHAHLGTCMWRQEEEVGWRPLSLSTLFFFFFKTRPLTEPRVRQVDYTGWSKSLGTLLSLHPQPWDYQCTQLGCFLHIGDQTWVLVLLQQTPYLPSEPSSPALKLLSNTRPITVAALMDPALRPLTSIFCRDPGW